MSLCGNTKCFEKSVNELTQAECTCRNWYRCFKGNQKTQVLVWWAWKLGLTRKRKKSMQCADTWIKRSTKQRSRGNNQSGCKTMWILAMLNLHRQTKTENAYRRLHPKSFQNNIYSYDTHLQCHFRRPYGNPNEVPEDGVWL